METTVTITWDKPEDVNWLCPANIKLALQAYCTNTKFEVVETNLKGKQMRTQIPQSSLDLSSLDVQKSLTKSLIKKGHGTFSSIHEISGVITEECAEFYEAIKLNNHALIKQELLDIAVACHFAIACINENTLDW